MSDCAYEFNCTCMCLYVHVCAYKRGIASLDRCHFAYVSMCVNLHVCMCVNKCVWMCLHVCMYVQACVRVLGSTNNFRSTHNLWRLSGRPPDIALKASYAASVNGSASALTWVFELYLRTNLEIDQRKQEWHPFHMYSLLQINSCKYVLHLVKWSHIVLQVFHYDKRFRLPNILKIIALWKLG